jgi:hypothetical protein
MMETGVDSLCIWIEKRSFAKLFPHLLLSWSETVNWYVVGYRDEFEAVLSMFAALVLGGPGILQVSFGIWIAA